MDEEQLTKQHISQQFNLELRELRLQVLSMGGLVEEQLANAVTALTTNDEQLAQLVYTNDYKINALEVAIDENSTRILARRQPAASDLRLVMAVVRSITDLERIGDESKRIAQMCLQLGSTIQPKWYVPVVHFSEHVRQMLHDALDAFARMDAEVALQILREDSNVDSEYESTSRQLITYMMEDARCIPSALNIMWAARALERIAAHSSNICEHLIYLVKGKDIRHTSLDQIEQSNR